MNAIIISIGNELTSGQTIDTNSSYLAMRLGERGIETTEHQTISDGHSAIASAIKTAAAKADLVIISGGLGPTEDDQTRQGLAGAMGTSLELDEDCLETIGNYFKNHGWEMSAVNRVQAMVPKGAQALENKAGTAPGLTAEIGPARIFVTPGVPHEMRRMFDEQIAPMLDQGTGVITHYIIHTFGQGESTTGDAIGDLMRQGGDVSVGTTVAAGMVSIRITSRGADAREAQLKAAEVIDEIRSRLGDLVIGEGAQTTMAAVVGQLLREKQRTLSTAESCTGGLIGQLITNVSGASDYYPGGFICYSNHIKQQLLGVPSELLKTHGAVSEQVASAMAEGAREKMGTDFSIAVTGIAGPTGGTDEKPVGLVYIAITGDAGTKTHRHIFAGDRQIIRLRTALSALNYLRLELLA